MRVTLVQLKTNYIFLVAKITKSINEYVSYKKIGMIFKRRSSLGIYVVANLVCCPSIEEKEKDVKERLIAGADRQLHGLVAVVAGDPGCMAVAATLSSRERAPRPRCIKRITWRRSGPCRSRHPSQGVPRAAAHRRAQQQRVTGRGAHDPS
jgi:hypothetical protein